MARRAERRDLISLPGFQGMSVQEVLFAIEYVKDFLAGAAAVRAGMSSARGAEFLERPLVQAAINLLLERRRQEVSIDAEWVMWEAVDNHTLARQMGNLTASNKALEIIGRLATVDAFAAEKVKVSVDDDMMARLDRGRQRARQQALGEEAVDGELVEETPALPAAAPDVIEATAGVGRPIFL